MHEPTHEPTAEPMDLRDPDLVCGLLRGAAEAFWSHPDRRGSTVHLTDDTNPISGGGATSGGGGASGGGGSVVVSGDLHDHPLNAARLFKLAALDQHRDRHLILQELIHGEQRINNADLSIRIVARVCALVKQHPTRVHVLLSNHELAQMHRENILKDGHSVCGAFTEGLAFLYNDDAERVFEAFVEYVKALPLAVRTSGGLFFSHSLPAPRRIEAFDKGVLDRALSAADLAPRGSAYDMVWGRHHNRTITQELAEAWGVRTFVLGHQPAEMGYEAVADNTLVINSDHDHGVAVLLKLSSRLDRDALYEHIVPLNSVSVEIG